jgi:methylmalonyl-CoA mutase
VLRREGRIGDVADPCAGAYFLETLTDAIAREAFNIWQELEAGGGILPALRDGALQRRIAVQRADVLAAIASRSVAIVGVSVSPAATVAASGSGRDDVALPFAADALASIQDVGGARDALRIGATIAAVEASIARCGDDNDAEVCTPLCAMRWATGWEVLRQRLDGLGDAAPLVFLAALGPPNRHKGRLDFARELFTAGGFRVAEGPSGANVESIATALTASGCDGVAICGHDDDVARSALALCAEVQRFAPRFIAVMGRPRAAEAELRIAGVNHFVFLGSDVLAQLNACAQRCGAGEGSRP